MRVSFFPEADEEGNIDDSYIFINSGLNDSFAESFVELYFIFIWIAMFLHIIDEFFDELEAVGADGVDVVDYWIFLFVDAVSQADQDSCY